MFKWIIASLFAIITFLFLYIAMYVGAFRPVAWSKGAKGPYYIVFQSQRGPYDKITNTILTVEEAFKKMGIVCTRTFGRYLDNPATTDSDRLRADAGCLFDFEPKDIPEGLELQTLPKKEYLVAEFSGAPSIGPFKVYPEARRRLSKGENKVTDLHPIEIYEITPGQGVTTTYLFEL